MFFTRLQFPHPCHPKKPFFFSVLVSVFFVICLYLCVTLLFPVDFFKPLSHKPSVNAKQSLNDDFSKAHYLSCHSTVKKRLPAYHSLFYYLSGKEPMEISFQSGHSSAFCLHFFSDRGNRLPVTGKQKGKKIVYSINSTTIKKNTRIFLRVSNQTNNSYSFSVTALNAPQKTSSVNKPPNKKTSTSQIPDKTPAPDRKTKPAGKKISYILSRSFLHCKTGEKRQLNIIRKSKKFPENKITWISLNPSVATVKKGLLAAKKQGITVIAARYRHLHTASCLIRVIN